MPSITEKLRGLVLNATEIYELTGWPERMIEDYLDIISNIIVLAEILGGILNVTTITSTDSPYTITNTDSKIVADSSSGFILIIVPPASGITGQNITVTAVDVSNDVKIEPTAPDTIGGESDFDFFADQEALQFYSDGSNLQVA